MKYFKDSLNKNEQQIISVNVLISTNINLKHSKITRNSAPSLDSLEKLPLFFIISRIFFIIF